MAYVRPTPVSGVEPDYVSPSLYGRLYRIDDVEPHPSNPRQGDVGKLVGLLESHGQVRAIIADPRTGYVLAGNHVRYATRELHRDFIAIDWYEGDDPEGFLLADNAASDAATYDDVVLAELLRGRAEASMLIGTGYDGDDVDLLVKRIDPETPDDFADVTGKKETNRECPKCGYAYEEK